MRYLNREERRKYFKKNKKKLTEKNWQDFNVTFIKKEPIKNDKTK